MAYKNKEGERQNKKEYYQKNREKILRKKKEYYQQNKEIIQKRMRSYGKKWYLKNKERIQLKHKGYYQKNKEKISQYHKNWYKKNRKKLLENSGEYYRTNRKKIQQRHKIYNRNNKETLLQYKEFWQKYKRKTDPKYRLDENMGSAIARSLRGKKDNQPWEMLIDYTLGELMTHLEKQFDNKMNWSNYGKYWAVDHIKPKSLFNYASPSDSEFKDCWTLENLQPLEKIKNIKKRNYYII